MVNSLDAAGASGGGLMIKTVGSVASPRAERWFYCCMAALITLTVFIGFAPTFYLAKWLDPPQPIQAATPLVYLHGAIFTGWILLFIAQTALIAGRRIDMHRKLGVLGAVLAALMVVVGTLTALHGVVRASGPPGIEPARFLAIPLFDLVVFSVLVVLGVRARRIPEVHKRLMLLSMIAILSAAIARWPLAIMQHGPLAFFAVNDLYVLLLVGFDLATMGRGHRATVWVALVIVISQPLRLAISATAAWVTFAHWAVSLIS